MVLPTVGSHHLSSISQDMTSKRLQVTTDRLAIPFSLLVEKGISPASKIMFIYTVDMFKLYLYNPLYLYISVIFGVSGSLQHSSVLKC